jgi:hypothetical protein
LENGLNKQNTPLENFKANAFVERKIAPEASGKVETYSSKNHLNRKYRESAVESGVLGSQG